MFHRFAVVVIVGFWLLMASLLARTVWFQGDERPSEVPPEYVGKLVFRHELASDLILYRQRRRIDGSFHLQPKRQTVSDGREIPGNLLSASGNFLLALPGLSGQRVVFHGAVEIDPHNQIHRINFAVSLHEPKGVTPGATLRVDGQPVENLWHYQLTQGGETLREGSGKPEELLSALDARSYGIDPGLYAQVSARASTTTITARRGKLRLSDDEIDTYVVTFRQGEGLETTVHVNQVGQVLAVKTPLGFDLYDETLSP